MKKSLLLIILFLIFNTAFSQDYIYLMNGKKVAATVLEVSKEKIRYHALDDPEGVTRELSVNDVYMIAYRNGKEEIFGLNIPVRREKYFSNGKNENYSLSFGGGESYGFIGLRFQHRWGGLQGWAYHVGVGLSPYGTPEHQTTFNFSAGMKYFFYKGWYLDLQFGTFPTGRPKPTTSDTLHSTDINFQEFDVRTAYGISFLLGGDWYINRFVGFNAAMGAAYNLTKPGYKRTEVAVDFGFFVRILDNRKK